MKPLIDIAGSVLKRYRRKSPASFRFVLTWSLAFILVFIIWLCYDSTELEQFCSSHVVFPVISLILAIVGIIFGLRSLFDSYQQEIRLEKQHSELEVIAKSISTRYIGSFPNHLKDIGELAGHAEKTFCILADCVDYGSFSHPKLHDEVLEKIKAARAAGVVVRILIYCDPAPFSRSSPFFGKTYEELIADEKLKGTFIKILDDYLLYHPDFKRPSTEKEFRQMMQEKQDSVWVDLERHNVLKQEYSDDPNSDTGLFFWLEDDVEAVFLLSHTGTKTQGLAFRTRDAKLVEIFKSTFDTKWKECENKREQMAKAKAAKEPVLEK
jgi:hypothetical protein